MNFSSYTMTTNEPWTSSKQIINLNIFTSLSLHHKIYWTNYFPDNKSSFVWMRRRKRLLYVRFIIQMRRACWIFDGTLSEAKNRTKKLLGEKWEQQHEKLNSEFPEKNYSNDNFSIKEAMRYKTTTWIPNKMNWNFHHSSHIRHLPV